ncbi:MAG: DNA-binding NtrC family response regulator [Candidatus Latescibacterota bacterium]|jgi:DNA-binding NtrC family response regulator
MYLSIISSFWHTFSLYQTTQTEFFIATRSKSTNRRTKVATQATQDILIVDDDDLVRKFLRITLERAGYQVRTATNGIEALKIHEEKPAALVITDILMPEKDGLEILMEFKSLSINTQVIAISGGGAKGRVDFLKQAQAFGAKRTFTKPIDPTELIKAVKQLLIES